MIALALVALGLSSDALAAGRHSRRYGTVNPGNRNTFAKFQKLDGELSLRIKNSKRLTDTADVILMLEPGQTLPMSFKRFQNGRRMSIINGFSLKGVPVGMLKQLADLGSTHALLNDRPAGKHDALSTYSVIANAIDSKNNINQKLYGYTGAGIRVAVLDSGISGSPLQDLVDSRISFLDFVNDTNTVRRDGDGHGTHVAGIIGGTGALSGSKYAGIAPGASIVSLKVLNDQGQGTISNILQGLNWIYENPQANIRVVNMSVGAPVTSSYWDDPLTIAAKALVDRGIVVVAAAGNFGQNKAGQPLWGAITSPGIAPWVLTVCAFSTQGTYNMADDNVAGFSSAGPTAIDFGAKPDVCAPGVGIVSLTDPLSTLYNQGLLSVPSTLVSSPLSVVSSLVGGGSATKPYMSLSGTSMAAPLVSGAVALMLQANPKLTPNLVKAILEFTATPKAGVSPLKQGAGFVNVAGALSLAAAYRTADTQLGYQNTSYQPVSPTDVRTATAQMTLKMSSTWSRHFIWGNHMMAHGIMDPRANAWRLGTVWGGAQASDGDNIVWGTASDGDNIVWGTASDGDNIVWGTASDGDNIVWGTASDGDNIVWGTASDGDNIVWGTSSSVANIVWPVSR